MVEGDKHIALVVDDVVEGLLLDGDVGLRGLGRQEHQHEGEGEGEESQHVCLAAYKMGGKNMSSREYIIWIGVVRMCM